MKNKQKIACRVCDTATDDILCPCCWPRFRPLLETVQSRTRDLGPDWFADDLFATRSLAQKAAVLCKAGLLDGSAHSFFAFRLTEDGRALLARMAARRAEREAERELGRQMKEGQVL